ncbi:MAG: hypothetical protein PHH61_06225 [Candidatus Nanoarchaeia archaeon]|nr:hypothetical protein [Candidatus Nanoarchaeia archaeon]
MSTSDEFDKLFTDYAKKLDKLNTKFYVAWDKLQKTCQHANTHWMQELDRKGNYKEGLFLRCFDCGATIRTLSEMETETINSAMKAFDDTIEDALEAKHALEIQSSKEQEPTK